MDFCVFSMNSVSIVPYLCSMNKMRRQHWQTIYETKQPHEVSWTQEKPQPSLDFITNLKLPKDAAIIDIGGGESRLVDELLDRGFTDITVLDISGKALERAQKRLGQRAGAVRWIESDILDFHADHAYDVWHDRAAFHFLTEPAQVAQYINTVKQCVKGHLFIGTFSENGPKKCSGLDITQYNTQTLQQLFAEDFTPTFTLTQDHHTPFGTVQNFVFAGFVRKA